MRLKATIWLFCCVVALGNLMFAGCSKKDTIVKTPTPVNFAVPQNFPAPLYDFSDNPLTKEGIELGRKLFYDGILSKDGTFPCASCHQQSAGFGTFDHDLSHGYNNSHTLRNAPGLANLAWQKSFRYDGGAGSLEMQALSHITAPDEMAETVAAVVAKLKASGLYRQAFQNAFGDEDVTSQRMLKALAQFMVTLVSANSKYDKVARGEAQFTFTESAGYEVFKKECASCHKEPLFTDGSFRNNGIGLNPFLQDGGRSRITGNSADSLKFRVPSLRNVVLSFPYMHDGRFTSLQQCLEHYRSGVKQSPTLDPSLQFGIGLSNTNIANLTSFLRTLTDSGFVKDPRFAAP
jgi:cytochrome c peroxidase